LIILIVAALIIYSANYTSERYAISGEIDMAGWHNRNAAVDMAKVSMKKLTKGVCCG